MNPWWMYNQANMISALYVDIQNIGSEGGISC
jgi:hypothetical protein